jgi:hypothetical protein
MRTYQLCSDLLLHLLKVQYLIDRAPVLIHRVAIYLTLGVDWNPQILINDRLHHLNTIQIACKINILSLNMQSLLKAV